MNLQGFYWIFNGVYPQLHHPHGDFWGLAVKEERKLPRRSEQWPNAKEVA